MHKNRLSPLLLCMNLTPGGHVQRVHAAEQQCMLLPREPDAARIRTDGKPGNAAAELIGHCIFEITDLNNLLNRLFGEVDGGRQGGLLEPIYSG